MFIQSGHSPLPRSSHVISRDSEDASNSLTIAIGDVSELVIGNTICPRVLPLDASEYFYLPTDPYAEGARARRAGLTGDCPYLLWPCVAAQWLAGWRGERS